MPSPRSLLGLFAALLAVAATATAQSADALPACHRDRICVKLVEGSGADLQGGVLRSRTGVDLRAAARLFRRAAAEPLITALPWEQLDALHANACAKLPEGRRPGHLGLWFRLRIEAALADQLLADLLEEPLIETAYLEPIYYAAGAAPPPNDIPPTTPLWTSLQHAHEPNPVGHGIRIGQGILGGRGRGVAFRMVEFAWYLDHEDVSQLTAANFLGAVPPLNPQDANHGVAGSSLLFADRNGYGITGIVDEVEVKFLAVSSWNGVEDALVAATAASQPGDVMMLVAMVLIPQLGPGAWLPTEFFQSMFDATLTLTANDRILVVCAGNGGRSLDDPQLLRRFDRTFRDSGAIIVASSDAGALVRAQYSNWGSRIDAHSWGNQVVSAGYGTLFFGNNDPRQAYTNGYSGTSASTPHIAGVVMALQGVARRQLGRSLTLAEIQAAIHDHGVTSPDMIARRPDLPAMLRALGLVDGLWVDAPETVPGGLIEGTLESSQLIVAGLFLSPNAIDVDLGWNRNLHLDPGFLIGAGTYVVNGAPVPWSMALPNDPTLSGFELYFQAARMDTNGVLELSSSGHVTVR